MFVSEIKVKSILWFVSVLFSVLMFPIQVYVNNTFPALLPYIVILLILFITLYNSKSVVGPDVKSYTFKSIGMMVCVYIYILVLNTGVQAVLNEITVNEMIRVFVIHFTPLIYYYYFRQYSSEREIIFVLYAVIFSGLLIGVYFAYDSFLKLALGEVSEYAIKAFMYSLEKIGGDLENANTMRIYMGYRSLGLLETHSVSGAYMVVATMAALALIPIKLRVMRVQTIFLFGLLLLTALNFTAIIAFLCVLLLFEFGGFEIFNGKISFKFLYNILFFIFALPIALYVLFFLVGENMQSYMITLAGDQLQLLLGTGGKTDLSMGGLLKKYLIAYMNHVDEYPILFFFGDGFGAYGMRKGGDIGLVETMAKFGMPLFLVIMFGFIRLFKTGFCVIATPLIQTFPNQDAFLFQQSMIRFSLAFFTVIFVTEGHYTVWASKTFLPVLFFCLALAERYLPVAQSGLPPLSEQVSDEDAFVPNITKGFASGPIAMRKERQILSASA